MEMDAEGRECSDTPGFLKELDRLEENVGFIRRTMSALPAWVTPNRITVLRGSMAVPAAYMLATEAYWTALVLLVTAVVLDAVDGWLARTRNQQSELGAFIDPVMDKLIICVPLMTLAIAGPLYTIGGWVVACSITAIETGLIVLRLIKRRRSTKPDGDRPDQGARNIGKHKMRVQSTALATIIIGLALGCAGMVAAGIYLMILALLLGMASFISHLPRFRVSKQR